MNRGSPLQSPRESGSPAHQWLALHAALLRAHHANNGAAQASRAIANQVVRLDSRPWFHPFKIYRFPQQARHYADKDDWRKVMVHCANPLPSSAVSYSGSNGSVNPYEYDWLGGQTVPDDATHFTVEWPAGSRIIQPIATDLPWHEVIVPDDGQLYYVWATTSVSTKLTPGSGLILVGSSATNALSLYDGTILNDTSGFDLPSESGGRFLLGTVQVLDDSNGKRVRIRQMRDNFPSGGGGSGGSEQLFVLQAEFPDYLVGKARIGGAIVNVLKDWKLRNTAQTNYPIDGTFQTYTYAQDIYGKWVRTQVSTGEKQIVIPRYTLPLSPYAGDEFKAAPIAPTLWAGTTYSWIETTQRAWARLSGT